MKKIDRCSECRGMIIQGKHETYCQECGLIAEDKSIKVKRSLLDPELVEKKNNALNEEIKK